MSTHKTLWIGILIMAILLSACGTATNTQAIPPVTRTLNVTGSGQIYLTPDIANITIGVHTEAEDAADAVSQNNVQAQQVIEMLKAQGVNEKDIQTTNFSIYPQQRYDERGEMTGTIYVVENSVYVTVRDLSKIGKLLDAVVASGANTIYGVQFDVADKVSALSEARKKAIENARTQAEELAQAAGVSLGAIQNISVYGGFPMPMYDGKGGEAMVAVEAPISPGQVSLNVEVNIVFEIH